MAKEKTKPEKQQSYKQVGERSFKTVFDQYLFYRFSRGRESTIGLEDFKTFTVTQEIIDEYVHEYWQKEYDYDKEGIWVNTIKDIGNEIYKWEHDKRNEPVSKEFMKYYVAKWTEKIYPEKKFMELLEEKNCEYCDITEEMIVDLIANHKVQKKKLTRGWSLEIDRKEPILEYTPKNCVRCCYWCNSAKTDEFSAEEFIPIGEAIKKIWHDRLNS